MQKTKYGSACKPVPGYDVNIIKPDNTAQKRYRKILINLLDEFLTE